MMVSPDWLKSPRQQRPKSIASINEEEMAQQKQQTVVSANNIEFESISQLAKRKSKFAKTVRILAWILYFQRKSKHFRKITSFTDEEISNAQTVLFHCKQTECFSDEEHRKS